MPSLCPMDKSTLLLKDAGRRQKPRHLELVTLPHPHLLHSHGLPFFLSYPSSSRLELRYIGVSLSSSPPSRKAFHGVSYTKQTYAFHLLVWLLLQEPQTGILRRYVCPSHRRDRVLGEKRSKVTNRKRKAMKSWDKGR